MTDTIAQSTMLSNFKIIVFTILLFLIVFFAPFAIHFDLGPGPNAIEAVVWQYIESDWQVGFWFQNPLRYFDYIIIRILFPLQFLRYCLGRSRRKVTLLVAAYSELHVALLSLPVYISWYFGLGVFLSPDGHPIKPIFLPIPLLFIGTVLLMLYMGRRK